MDSYDNQYNRCVQRWCMVPLQYSYCAYALIFFFMINGCDSQESEISPAVSSHEIKQPTSATVKRQPSQEVESRLLDRIIEGDIDSVKSLLDSGLDVDVPIKLFRKALPKKRSARPDEYDEWPPLVVAALNGHHELIKLILKYGADPDVSSNLGATALMAASSRGHSAIVDSLISSGADVNAKDNWGRTAIMRESYPTRETLVLKEVLETSVNGFDDLASAIRKTYHPHGKINVIEALINAGADVNAADKEGQTSLKKAIKQGDTHVAQVLIDAGADVNALDKYGFTYLIHTILLNQPTMAKLLIAGGAEVDFKDDTGNTALMYACRDGEEELVRILFEAGANLQLKNNEGQTAISLIRGSNSALVRFLEGKKN